MSFRFLEDEAMADIAFEAEGKELGELFQAAGLALSNVMVRDLSALEQKEKREFSIENSDKEMLLLSFLDKLVYYKDAEQLVFSRLVVAVDDHGLVATATGERIDPEKHILVVDVKATTLHNFSLKNEQGVWKAHVVLDI